MDTAALDRVGEQLDTFVGEVFSSLPRKDQRAKVGLYARGLMLDVPRKSMQPMAQRLQVDYQQLQQFSGHLAVGRGAGGRKRCRAGRVI